MRAVGIRELKTHLSRHLKDVTAGASLAVTERGRIIATIHPAGGHAGAPELEWAGRLVAQGRAAWLRDLQGRTDVRFSSFDDRLNRAARRLSRAIG